MSKRFICILFNISMVLPIFCQQIPNDIKITLDKLKYESERSLKLIRINRDSCHLYIGLLQNALPHNQSEQLKKMNINIDLGIVYNNDMRNRIIQLLNNEYKDEEIDTLVNRHLLQSMLKNRLLALELCKYDTSELFRYKLDSIIKLQKTKKKWEYSYIHNCKSDVIKLLKIDTTYLFKNKIDSLCAYERKSFVSTILNSSNEDLSAIATLCGYIDDKRFIQPLISALYNANDLDKKSIITALARMKVEPYSSKMLNKNIHSLKDISSGIISDYTLFVDELRSQKSFLELSKYLKSNVECRVVADCDNEGCRYHGDELKYCIFELIYNNLDNKDLKKLVGKGVDKYNMPSVITPEIDLNLEKMYVWMQKNYGRYKISWYHY